jgi:CheY-like chemotaxis protein
MATVLICDDQESFRLLAREILEEVGYSVIEAPDGDQCVDLVRLHRPDVVVLDVMMPERPGISVLRQLRNDPELAATKVIVVSAIGRLSGRLAAEQAGADAYLGKPFNVEELVDLVAKVHAG